MSVVTCKITDTGFDISADSISVRGMTQTRGQNSSFSKLWTHNGLIVGAVGSAEEASLLRLFVNTHTPLAPEELAILEFFSEFSDWKNKKVGKSGISNAYLLGYGDKVFYISGWFVKEVTTYEAIGAGKDFALAALYLGHTAEKAVETAIELSIYCEAPVQLIQHDSGKENAAKKAKSKKK